MSNEATVRSSLRVRFPDGNLDYSPPVRQFRASVSVERGPTPGYLNITTTGENVLFDELTNPGLCRIKNLDTANYVEFGLHDGGIFHPWGEVLPGEEYVFRFSRNFRQELDVSPGTGSTADVNTFFLRANTAACGVIVDCFEA